MKKTNRGNAETKGKSETARIPLVTQDEDGRIITDPFGSWTGVSTDNVNELPIQDVDDL